MSSPILFSVCLLVSACAIFSKAREENINQVQLGQTPEQVTAAIGEPTEKSGPPEAEHWQYNIISRDQKSTYPYSGDFENGKLIRWYFDTGRISSKHSAQKSGLGKREKRATDGQ